MHPCNDDNQLAQPPEDIGGHRAPTPVKLMNYSFFRKSQRMCISHSPSSHRSNSGETTPEVYITTGLNGTEQDASRFYYQNVRGLRTKIDDLYVATIDCSFDVIVLTETGLNDAINSVQLFGNSYDVYRCDRSRRNSDKSSFGGVLIAVRRIHSSFVIETSSGTNLEQISVSANIHGKSFKICAVYIPPDRSRTAGVLESHIATVREICESTTNDESVIAVGDYNQPHLGTFILSKVHNW